MVDISMDEIEVKNIIKLFESGIQTKDTVYSCCGLSFTSLFEFRKHLFTAHPAEYELYFKDLKQSDRPFLLTKEELHKRVNKSKRRKEKVRRKMKSYARSLNSKTEPAKGDYFRIIYTPMGNKR